MDSVVFSSFVIKRGESRKNWRRRWLALTRDGLVMYFKSKPDANCKRLPKPCGLIKAQAHCVGITEYDDCDCIWPQPSTSTNSFGLKTTYRTYYFTCDTDSECAGWKQVIKPYLGGITDKPLPRLPTESVIYEDDSRIKSDSSEDELPMYQTVDPQDENQGVQYEAVDVPAEEPQENYETVEPDIKFPQKPKSPRQKYSQPQKKGNVILRASLRGAPPNAVTEYNGTNGNNNGDADDDNIYQEGLNWPKPKKPVGEDEIIYDDGLEAIENDKKQQELLKATNEEKTAAIPRPKNKRNSKDKGYQNVVEDGIYNDTEENSDVPKSEKTYLNTVDDGIYSDTEDAPKPQNDDDIEDGVYNDVDPATANEQTVPITQDASKDSKGNTTSAAAIPQYTPQPEAEDSDEEYQELSHDTTTASGTNEKSPTYENWVPGANGSIVNESKEITTSSEQKPKSRYVNEEAIREVLHRNKKGGGSVRVNSSSPMLTAQQKSATIGGMNRKKNKPQQYENVEFNTK